MYISFLDRSISNIKYCQSFSNFFPRSHGICVVSDLNGIWGCVQRLAKEKKMKKREDYAICNSSFFFFHCCKVRTLILRYYCHLHRKLYVSKLTFFCSSLQPTYLLFFRFHVNIRKKYFNLWKINSECKGNLKKSEKKDLYV